jgi:predicted permease
VTVPAAIRQGVLTALVLALPAGLLNQFVVDRSDGRTPFVLLLWVVILFGGAAGGFAVLRLSPAARLSHAAAAAGAAYVIVQTIGVVRRLFVGAPISWLAFPLLATLMATCGMLGGAFARRWERNGGTAGGGGGTADDDREGPR